MTTLNPQAAPAKRAGRRMQFTADPLQERVLRRAAAAVGKPVGAFVAERSSAAAYQMLIESPDFQLDDPDWEHFLGLLGLPVGEKDHLRALLQSDG